MSWYQRLSSPKGTRHTFPKVLIGDIRAFPIRIEERAGAIETKRISRVVELVQSMHKLRERAPDLKTNHDRTVIERQIEATDREIDRLVYELYGLSQVEIRLVEAAVK